MLAMDPWLVAVVAVFAALTCGAAPPPDTVVGAEGCVACLPCPVDAPACGAVHSVVWRRRDAAGSRLLVVDARRNRSHVVADPQRSDACLDARGRRWGLQLRSLRLGDAGWYRCEVTYVRPHDGCPLHAEARLVVAPIRVKDASLGRLVDDVGPLRVGDVLALDCEGPGASWWSEGRSLGVAALRTEVALRDRGRKLRCGCDDVGGVTVQLRVEAEPVSAVLSVLGDVVEGGELRALCVASGAFPAASVTWFRDAREVTRGQRDEVRHVRAAAGDHVLTTSSVLSIPAKRHLHGATLSCSARNRASRRPATSATATIRVLYPPGRPTLVATPWTPLRGAPLTLRCLASDPGRPQTSSFEWTRDARRLCAATPWPWLRLRGAARGFYACRAVNAVGPGASSRAVLVEPWEAPRIVQVTLRELRLREGYAFPGSAPRCDARGLPEPSILWRRQGDAHAVAVGDSLALGSPVTRGDSGVYVCEASNSVGVATASVVISVLFAPDCQVSPRGRRLRCCARGNPSEVSVSWTLSGVELKSNCSVVEAVRPGEYVCRPRNTVGVGRSCRATVTEADGAETSLLLALGALASVAALSAGRRRLRRNCSCECGCGGGVTLLSRCSCCDAEAGGVGEAPLK